MGWPLANLTSRELSDLEGRAKTGAMGVMGGWSGCGVLGMLIGCGGGMREFCCCCETRVSGFGYA